MPATLSLRRCMLSKPIPNNRPPDHISGIHRTSSDRSSGQRERVVALHQLRPVHVELQRVGRPADERELRTAAQLLRELRAASPIPRDRPDLRPRGQRAPQPRRPSPVLRRVPHPSGQLGAIDQLPLYQEPVADSGGVDDEQPGTVLRPLIAWCSRSQVALSDVAPALKLTPPTVYSVSSCSLWSLVGNVTATLTERAAATGGADCGRPAPSSARTRPAMNSASGSGPVIVTVGSGSPASSRRTRP
ncbi:hypothetical protein LX90_009322 [Lentzea flava]|nr:hypothetical protein [Lentzea flava]